MQAVNAGPTGRRMPMLTWSLQDCSLRAMETRNDGQDKQLAPQLNRIVLYARDVEATVRFYERHFGFEAHREDGDRIVELGNPDGGASLMLHPASKGQKTGQSVVKLVFDVEDVEGFRARSANQGLMFGALHKGDGYVFANAHDPCGNAISISSRAFRNRK
jgi:predicted enzyme related to lactoylglutathione lyase